MIHFRNWFLFCLNFCAVVLFAQQPQTVEVFKNTLVNFSNEGEIPNTIRLQSGRLLIKKVKAPVFKKGTDVSIKVKLRSNGDSWDKAGSVFVLSPKDQNNILKIAQGKAKFPSGSAPEAGFYGVLPAEGYNPPVELMRFMTPFGVGHFSDTIKFPKTKLGRPVSVPTWADFVEWNQDISQLQSLLMGEFYVGVWIDTWTKEGYLVDISLEYSGRPRPIKKVLPLVSTVYYIDGQKIPDFFSRQTLQMSFDFPKVKKSTQPELYYITSGHGGHEKGDEFVKKQNTVSIDHKPVLDFIPWRDDCASFRRFSPTSGVWVQKDTVRFYNDAGGVETRVIEERLASSDLSRSNWCPGSQVLPEIAPVQLSQGKHVLAIKIPATANKENQQNHWMVSAYLVY
ncbi:PNGase F N-terminal domain-containing protein [Ornithobacterium rhinotracheale]